MLTYMYRGWELASRGGWNKVLVDVYILIITSVQNKIHHFSLSQVTQLHTLYI